MTQGVKKTTERGGALFEIRKNVLTCANFYTENERDGHSNNFTSFKPSRTSRSSSHRSPKSRPTVRLPMEGDLATTTQFTVDHRESRSIARIA